jgi:hypothetical protein
MLLLLLQASFSRPGSTSSPRFLALQQSVRAVQQQQQQQPVAAAADLAAAPEQQQPATAASRIGLNSTSGATAEPTAAAEEQQQIKQQQQQQPPPPPADCEVEGVLEQLVEDMLAYVCSDNMPDKIELGDSPTHSNIRTRCVMCYVTNVHDQCMQHIRDGAAVTFWL